MEVAKSTPLCLPNNLTWDPDTGKIQKVRSARGSLCVVPAAIEMLQKIKDPVCVVAITGPYRIGKSYILGEVFGQMEVFSIGHAMDPETLGIWMWIVPEKFKDTRGRDFRVILLDSEGISSVQTEDGDDNQIFTLSVLLASLLIYNSKGVPERTDLDKLKFIAKLAQRIRYHSKEGQNDQEFFRNTFPFFVWLLRDKTQKIPEDCRDLNHFFSTRVFKESPASTASADEKSRQKVAESILNYFSGFESFALPMPSVDEDVMQDISKSKDKLNVKFLKEVQRFESLLKSKMAPKRSINPGEFVTGEALAMLVELYTAAINDQNLMPNVEAAWDTYVKKKCSEAEEKALKIYDEVMTGLMASQLPCDGEEIQRNHEKAQRQSMEAFEEETANLNSTIIDKEWKQLTKSIDERLGVWTDQNAALTQNSCEHLLRRLKAQHLDPVLERVCGPSGAQVNYSEIMNGWSMIKTDFDLKAVGARDVKADVFFDFNKGLQEEVMKYEEILKKMKDYDKDLSKEKIARAYQEKEKRRLEEHIAQLKKQEEGWKRKMEKLEKRQQQDLDAIKEQAKVDKEEWSKQMKMMREADMKTQAQLQKQLDTAIDREKQANRAMADTRKALDETRKEAEASRVAADQYWKDVESKITETTKMFQDQLKLSADRERQSTKVINDMIRMREDDQKVVASLRDRIQSLDDQLKDATKPGFIRRIWRAIFN